MMDFSICLSDHKYLHVLQKNWDFVFFESTKPNKPMSADEINILVLKSNDLIEIIESEHETNQEQRSEIVLIGCSRLVGNKKGYRNFDYKLYKENYKKAIKKHPELKNTIDDIYNKNINRLKKYFNLVEESLCDNDKIINKLIKKINNPCQNYHLQTKS